MTSAEAKNGDCEFGAEGAWQREQYSSSTGCTVVANRSGAVGKLLLAPASRIGGAFSSTPALPLPVLPAQAAIQVVRMSAQAAVLASQQLCPPATLVTSRESRGEASVTIELAAA